uniref:Uncharacterized protein n=1 Tax=Ciona intestinalis TaxID=7719 RepID=H2XX72_CIOIN
MWLCDMLIFINVDETDIMHRKQNCISHNASSFVLVSKMCAVN